MKYSLSKEQKRVSTFQRHACWGYVFAILVCIEMPRGNTTVDASHRTDRHAATAATGNQIGGKTSDLFLTTPCDTFNKRSRG